MNAVRYWLALLMLMFMPGAFLFWFLVHPFVRFWRRIGLRRTMTIHYTLLAAFAAGVFLLRKTLLAMDFGTNPVLIAVAVPILAASIVLRRRFSRHLRFKTLGGLPELAPERYPQRLLTEGIYSRIRHPRYVEVLLVMASLALVANNLAAYVNWIVAIPTVLVIVRIEERELRDRFGAEYEAYCARVPRFVPRRPDCGAGWP
ncbi:MAG: isoprenylcysteine carboxylmethyltransferase family protein [Bryobacteraceae bacterium]|jgi:protein-S-isoprenylcysteine O-methyltransferase Ste14